MSSELATVNGASHAGLAMWDHEQIDVIKNLICPGASDPELKLFAQVCGRTGLDPFSRQIYGIMRGQRQQIDGQWKTIEKLSIQTSIDGFRLIAERSGKYGGQLGPQWCGPDSQWRDVWLDETLIYPCAARVGVIRTDWNEPLWAVARWTSYVQMHKDKDGRPVVGAMWERMPDVMLAKVAESLALRRAFPAELSGLYTAEEMAQADNESAAPAPSQPRQQAPQQRQAVRAPKPAEPVGEPPEYVDAEAEEVSAVVIPDGLDFGMCQEMWEADKSIKFPRPPGENASQALLIGWYKGFVAKQHEYARAFAESRS